MAWRDNVAKKKGRSCQIPTEWKLDDTADGRNPVM